MLFSIKDILLTIRDAGYCSGMLLNIKYIKYVKQQNKL